MGAEQCPGHSGRAWEQLRGGMRFWNKGRFRKWPVWVGHSSSDRNKDVAADASVDVMQPRCSPHDPLNLGHHPQRNSKNNLLEVLSAPSFWWHYGSKWLLKLWSLHLHPKQRKKERLCLFPFKRLPRNPHISPYISLAKT